MKKEKLCVDCIYHTTIPTPRNRKDDHLCSFFKLNQTNVDLVTGEIFSPPLINCYEERELSGGCSVSGINFERKPS